MIKEVTMYTIACDNCKEEYEHDEFAAFTEAGRMINDAISYGGWIEDETGEKHYCPKCAHMDDEDNLIIDESRKKSVSLPMLDLKNLLTDVHQLITGWNATEDQWTEWDQKVKESVIALQLKIDNKDNVLFHQ